MKETKIKAMAEWIPQTMYRAVVGESKRFPDKEAIRFMGRSITYRCFVTEADEVAARFARLGIKKGDRVLLCMPNVPNIIVSIYALNKLGATVCPVHPQSSVKEIAFYLNDLDARLAVCFEALFPVVCEAQKEAGKKVPVITVAPTETLLFSDAVPKTEISANADKYGWKEFLSLEPVSEVEESLDAEALAIVFYSGGTTGTPKGVMLSSKNLNALAFQTEDGSGLIPMSDYSMLAAIPMFHGFGFGVNIHLMLSRGGTSILIPKFSPFEIGDIILKEKPSIIAGVPTVFYAIAMAFKDKDCDLSFLKGAFSGGDSVPQQLKDTFNACAQAHNSSARLREGYGLTESVTVNCISDFDGGKKGSMGRPLIGNEFIACAEGSEEPLPPSVPGEFCLSGPTVMMGYLNRPEETKRALHRVGEKIVLHTGDYGRIDEDGYLFFSSRLSRMIITNGYNVYPSEVENVVLSLPKVKQACCIGVSDEVQGQSVCLLIVPEKGADENALRLEIKEAAERCLAEYKRPKTVFFRESLPVTNVGKIAYGEIQKQMEESATKSATSPEEAFALVIKKVLGFDDIDKAEEFFNAGGNSYKIVVLLVELAKQGYELSLADFIKAKTKEEIIAAIRPLHSVSVRYENEAVAAELRKEGLDYDTFYPAGPMQESILYYYSVSTKKSVYNTMVILRALRTIDEGRFKQAAELLVEKYDAFRTIFRFYEDGAFAVVRKKSVCPIECVKTDLSVAEFSSDLARKGFDLKDNLFRMLLVRAADGEFVLYNVHHAVSDGISDFNAISYFIDSYLRLEKGETYQSLKEKIVRNDGFDYYSFLHGLGKADDSKAAGLFRREFEGFEGGEKIQPSREPDRGDYGKVDFALTEETDRKLRAFCQKNECTLKQICDVVWAIVLAKYTFTEDVAFGEVVSGREESAEGIDKAVGLFINTVPMRLNVAAGRTVKDLLKEVKEKSIAHLPYLTYPISKSIRLIGDNAVSTIVNYEDSDGKKYGIGADIFEQEYLLDNSNFDLEFEITGKGRLVYDLRYNGSVYSEEDMRLLGERILRVFESAITKDIRIKDIAIESKETIKKAAAFNKTEYAFDENETVVDRFEKQAKKTPDRVAVTYYDRRLTYRELDERSDGVAALLKENGIKKGDCVALQISRSPEMITAIFGVLKAGAVYLPLDESYPEERLLFVLSDSGAKAVLTDDPQKATVLPTFDVRTIPVFPKQKTKVTGDDRAYYIYTSGTTGMPKGVVTLHKGLSNLLLSYEKIYDLTEKDVVLQVASYTFDQSVWDIFGVLCVGGKLALISYDDVREPEKIALRCKEEGVTIASFTPAMIAELDPNAFPTLRILDSSGEAANATVLRRWVDRVTVINTYGPTEYTVNACSYRYLGIEDNVPIGKPILNTRFFVIDKNNALCAVEQEGELCIAGVGLAEGYLNRPELTAEKFVPAADGVGKMYRTGDVVRMREDGAIEFVSRMDEQVKIRGFRIELGEIDARLRKIAGVTDCCVTVKVISGDKTICAYIVGDTDRIKEKLKKSLPSYMIPQFVVSMPRIPRTLSGKTDLSSLPLPSLAVATKTPPATEKQKAVASAMEKVLGVSSLCIEDDFFVLGGDSIKAIRLSTKMQSAGYELSVRDIMSNHTVQEMANVVRAAKKEKSRLAALTPDSRIKERFGDRYEKSYPLTPLQEGILFHAMYDDSPQYLSQDVIKIFPLNPAVAKKAFQAIFLRYDVLRTAFVSTENGDYQVVLKDRMPEFSVIGGDINAIAEKEYSRGFDLEKDVLCRVVYVEGEQHYLILTYHHLVADGWSSALLYNVFFEYYSRLIKGEDFGKLCENVRNEAKNSYAFSDFVRYLLSKNIREAEEYYKDLLKDFAGTFDYPSINPERPALGVAAERVVSFPYKVREEAKRFSTTGPTLLEVAWGVVLGVKSGTFDAIFGNVLSGRNEPLEGIENLVGMLISTAPIRVQFGKNTTFRTLIENVEKQNADNFSYGFVPLTGKAAKIGSIIVFNDYVDSSISEQIVLHKDQTNYDVELDVMEDGSSFTLRYNKHRYQEEEIDDLCALLSKALLAIADTPDNKVLDVMSTDVPAAPVRSEEDGPEEESVPLASDNEKTIAKAMADVLGIEELNNANANFLAYGGDSIKAIRLSAKLRNAGFYLSVKTIMEEKTIRKMAPLLTEAQTSMSNACGEVPPTPPIKDFFARGYVNPDAYLEDACLGLTVRTEELKNAVETLYKHHDLLRARYENGKLTVPEIIRSAPPVFVELTGEDLVETCKQVQKNISLSSALFAAARITVQNKTYVYFCAHHIVSDIVSMRILAEDLLTLLRGGRLPQKSTSFLSYAKACENFVVSEKEEEYLRSFVGREKTPFPSGNEIVRKDISFDKGFTAQFAKSGKACGAKCDDVLTTALARAMRSLLGTDGIVLLKESSGRDYSAETDLTRTVGWLSSYYPLRVSGVGEETACLARNKEAALSVPRGGTYLPFAEIAVAPDIVFNYSGEHETVKDMTIEMIRVEEEKINPERERLDVEGEIDKGKLCLSFYFNGVEEDFCEKLFSAFCAELKNLVKKCVAAKEIKTPGDYGLPGMPLEDFFDVLPYSPIRIAPLTSTQEGMLFHVASKDEYVEQSIVKAPALLTMETVKAAFYFLSQKYSALRTHYIITRSGNMYQYVTEEADFSICETSSWEETAKKRREEGVSPVGAVPLIIDFSPDVMVFTFHHVAFDLWSEDLILKELDAYLKGSVDRSPEPVRPCDHARDAQYAFSRKDYESWEKVLSGATAVSIPLHGEEAVAPFDFRLPYPEKAEAFGRERNVPINVLFESVTARFLQKLSGNTDVCFAKTLSGRNAVNAKAVGLFIKTLPVRVTADTCAGVVMQVEEQSSLALKTPCSVEDIMRRSKENVSFDVLLSFDNLETNGKSAMLMFDRTHYGITLNVAKEDGSYTVEITLSEGSAKDAEYFAKLYEDCYCEILGINRDAFPALEGKNQAYAKTINELFDLSREDFFVFDESAIPGSEIYRRASALGAFLHAKAGKSVVAVKTADPVNKLVAIYGVVFSGNAFLPIDVDCPAAREKTMLEETGAAFVLTDEFLSAFSFGGEEYMASPAPTDIAYILYTSGSTGKPKGVKVSHAALANRLAWMEKYYPLRGGAILQKTPYTFDVSLWEIFRPALFGGALVTMRGQYASPKDVAKRISEGAVTQVHFVPSAYEIFLDYCAQNDCARPQDVFLSGEKLSAALVKKHFEVFGKEVKLHNLYGPTECAVDVTYYDVEGDEKDVPIGKPIDNLQLSVRFGDQILPPYIEGEIVVGGVGVGSGYVGAEQGGFSQGLYRTGDIGYSDENGLLYFTRRKDALVKLHGVRISLTEVENAILSVEGVTAAAAMILGGENGYLCAFYVGMPDSISDALKDILPARMRPTRVIKVDSVPLTRSGKRDDAALSMLAEKSARPQSKASEKERVFLAICQEALGKEIGFDDSFAEAGVSSLDRIRLAVKLSSVCEFGDAVQVNSLRELFFATDLPCFIRFSSGAEKAFVCLPYAGGTGRMYEKLRLPGYDVYAAATATFDEENLKKALSELREIVRAHKETVVYAHCIGCLTAVRLTEEVPVDKVIFGAHIPDVVSSFFGRPVDGWKRVKDPAVISALRKGGLEQASEELSYFFKKDVARASVLEAEKHKTNVPATVLLADNDYFNPNVRVAKSRWKKLLDGPYSVRVLKGRGHYFSSDKDFGDILLSILGEKDE